MARPLLARRHGACRDDVGRLVRVEAEDGAPAQLRLLHGADAMAAQMAHTPPARAARAAAPPRLGKRHRPPPRQHTQAPPQRLDQRPGSWPAAGHRQVDRVQILLAHLPCGEQVVEIVVLGVEIAAGEGAVVARGERGDEPRSPARRSRYPARSSLARPPAATDCRLRRPDTRWCPAGGGRAAAGDDVGDGDIDDDHARQEVDAEDVDSERDATRAGLQARAGTAAWRRRRTRGTERNDPARRRSLDKARWWAIRPAQNRKPSPYRCPLCTARRRRAGHQPGQARHRSGDSQRDGNAGPGGTRHGTHRRAQPSCQAIAVDGDAVSHSTRCSSSRTSSAPCRRRPQAVERAVADAGPVELLVANAGISGPHGATWETEPEDWWRTFEVNVLGVHLCCRAVIPGMLERRSGRIVITGSGAAYLPNPSATAYPASKAAVCRYGEALAGELADRIPVFFFSPGLVRTDMTSWGSDHLPWTPPELAPRLVAALATGRYDALAGRYLHAEHDDLDDLLSRIDQVREQDLNAIRLRR